MINGPSIKLIPLKVSHKSIPPTKYFRPTVFPHKSIRSQNVSQPKSVLSKMLSTSMPSNNKFPYVKQRVFNTKAFHTKLYPTKNISTNQKYPHPKLCILKNISQAKRVSTHKCPHTKCPHTKCPHTKYQYISDILFSLISLINPQNLKVQ